MHVRNALTAGEIGRSQPDHAQAGSYCGSGMLAFRLEEDELAPVDVVFSSRHGRRPPLPHLRRRRNGIRARTFAGSGLHRHRSTAPVIRGVNTRILRWSG